MFFQKLLLKILRNPRRRNASAKSLKLEKLFALMGSENKHRRQNDSRLHCKEPRKAARFMPWDSNHTSTRSEHYSCNIQALRSLLLPGMLLLLGFIGSVLFCCSSPFDCYHLFLCRGVMRYALIAPMQSTDLESRIGGHNDHCCLLLLLCHVWLMLCYVECCYVGHC